MEENYFSDMDDPEEVKVDSSEIDEEMHGSSFGEHPSRLSVTAILHYCKGKIVRPYLRLLSITGLRPLTFDHAESGLFCSTVNWIYGIQILLLILFGYVLQYMACLRRDRGFCYYVNSSDTSVFKSVQLKIMEENLQKHEQICHGSVIFTYIIPSAFHLCAYLYAVYVFRSSEQDQLPSLMERVFVSSSYISDGFFIQKKLIKLLWIFVGLDVIWMSLSFITLNVMLFEGNVAFKWLDEKHNGVIIFLKIMLVLTTLYHDTIQATIISNYCLQAQLLTSYLQLLKAKVVQYPIHSLDWMREILEFKKLLKYLNDELSPPVCIFTFINLCWFISGILWIFSFDRIDKTTDTVKVISGATCCLWLTLILAPFVQAARLTGMCRSLQDVGHEVRIRPFTHQCTPEHELDSILLFTSSLRMEATLYKIPITGRTLSLIVIIGGVILLVFGQCHYLSN